MTVPMTGPATDPHDPRVARHATGLLRAFNTAQVLDAADVHVAERLGRLGRETDETVLLAAALAVRAVRHGSVCLDLGTVRDVTAEELPWPEDDAWRASVARSPLLAADVLRLEENLLYLDRYWSEEQQVVDDLRRRAATTPPSVDDARLEAALAAYFPATTDGDPDDQRAAAELAARQWTTVITGGPGTGKTTTVARLLGVLLDVHGSGPGGGPGSAPRPLRIALAAPTGKAAARMVEAVRDATHQAGFPPDHVEAIQALEASTLHRLLGWRPDSRSRFRHHRGNRLGHDVVVVDETSMVSLSLMARLLEAVRPEARLVLVGDPDQLASVEAGAVLHDLVDGFGSTTSGEGGSPVAPLRRTRRFGAEIGALAHAVRGGDADEVLALLRDSVPPTSSADHSGGGRSRVQWAHPDELPALLQERATTLARAAESGDSAGALQVLNKHRLLCAHRQGPFGVTHWNRVVEQLLREALGREWLPEWYAGRPFVVNSNDYGLELWNGDTGVVCASEGGLVAVVGDGSTQGRHLPTTRLADVSTAHAMTVHRSQGSQFEEVTVLLPDPDSRILTRELFYTAITRAQRVVRVVGTEESVRAAVTRRARRATGLARRLRAD